RDRRLAGMVREEDVAVAVREKRDRRPVIGREAVASVGPDTLLADMFREASDADSPVAVVDDEGKVLGTVPHVTLLAAAAHTPTNGADTGAAEQLGVTS